MLKEAGYLNPQQVSLKIKITISNKYIKIYQERGKQNYNHLHRFLEKNKLQ